MYFSNINFFYIFIKYENGDIEDQRYVLKTVKKEASIRLWDGVSIS